MDLVSVLFGNFTPIAESFSSCWYCIPIRTIVSNSRKTSKQSVSAHSLIDQSTVWYGTVPRYCHIARGNTFQLNRRQLKIIDVRKGAFNQNQKNYAGPKGRLNQGGDYIRTYAVLYSCLHYCIMIVVLLFRCQNQCTCVSGPERKYTNTNNINRIPTCHYEYHKGHGN